MKNGLTLTLALVATAGVALAAQAKGLGLPEDWRTYRHIGSLVITDKTHPLHGIHHFYVNKTGEEAFEKGEKYPDGTVIVDSVYQIAESGGILNEGPRAFFPVMKKNSAMKDTGGWEWAAFGPDGAKLNKDARRDCLSCHDSVKDADYVFSKPLK